MSAPAVDPGSVASLAMSAPVIKLDIEAGGSTLNTGEQAEDIDSNVVFIEHLKEEVVSTSMGEQELWWNPEKEQGQAANGKYSTKFDLGPYVGDKPVTELLFTELVYASMRWGVEFNWSSQKEVKGYMAHIGYIAMKAMAGLFVSEAMSSYDVNIRKAAELEGISVFLGYDTDSFCDEPFSSIFDITNHIHSGEYANPEEDNTDILPGTAEAHEEVDTAETAETQTGTDPGVLKKHRQKHPGKKAKYPCPQCGKNFMTPFSLKRHQIIHTAPKLHKCSDCGKQFRKATQLTIHMMKHTGEKPYKCSDCGKEFSQAATLCRHMKKHVKSENEESEDVNHACCLCKELFMNAASLEAHMLLVHAGEMPYNCTCCGKGFTRSADLKRHMITTHSGEKAYKCSQCQKGFLSPGLLKMHMRVHTGERPYQCWKCGKQFKQASTMATHMVTHGDNKPHACLQCGKAFRLAGTLRKHVASHTGDRPHLCTICGKRFIQAGTLKDHIKTHTGEKPYQCTKCGKQFRQSTNLRTHMRSHTDYRPCICTQCGKQFKGTGPLKEHLKTHTGERPHQCPECGKRFGRSNGLNRHMQMHRGEKPHECSVCEKRFSEAGNLKQHMRTHRGEKAHGPSHTGSKLFLQRQGLTFTEDSMADFLSVT